MSELRRSNWQSGRFRSPIQDFWQIAINLQDPEVPNLPLEDPAAGGFPTQFFGLRVQNDTGMIELCLVAEADAPGSMGGVIKTTKNGTVYAVYLVETTDPNASPVRVNTTAGIKAIRLKT